MSLSSTPSPSVAAPSARPAPCATALPSTLIDTAKALASQLIVAHHLVIYGPMSRQVQPLAPDLWAWLADPARLAVQVFLVIAGYLAARSLMPTPGAAGRVRAQALPRVLWQRVLRLAPVYWLAIALVLVTAAVARVWFDDPDTPPLPHAVQLIANLLFLQDVTGHEALSAGLWYVAIDLQLYGGLALFGAATALLGRVSERSRALLVVCTMSALVAASLYGFNRLQGWDAWAPYFFGAYGLGVLAHWLGRMSQPTWRGLGVAALCVLVAGALAVDFRSRIALAGTVAVLLVVSPAWLSWLGLDRQPVRALTAWLARLSYAVFLLHYPLSLAVAALVTTLAPDSLEVNLLGLIATWALTLACAHALERQIGLWQRRWRERRAEAARGALPVAG
ncbi:acyltransferase family protein [Leptothrix discophora]|uniref:Acyltransferase n=1 Tax=Leptothrix discophora TaxID=89 RepID=A0ABT9G1F0_LEPDI|nr:acyltransferase [Leptothrix discophora]MDP4300320.1 acyltransferase [Leptothrix discophora]